MMDIFKHNTRFFKRNSMASFAAFGGIKMKKVECKFMEPSFLYHFALGMQPRMFECDDP